jgi:hypothetical protein
MSSYAHVVDGNAVFIGSLPPDMKNDSEETLQSKSWYPFEEVHYKYDSTTHYLGSPDKQIKTDGDTGHKKMVYADVLVAFTEAQIKQNTYDQWFCEMEKTDMAMPSENYYGYFPRIIEDIITEIGIDKFNEKIQKTYNDKRAFRDTQPEKP